MAEVKNGVGMETGGGGSLINLGHVSPMKDSPNLKKPETSEENPPSKYIGITNQAGHIHARFVSPKGRGTAIRG